MLGGASFLPCAFRRDEKRIAVREPKQKKCIYYFILIEMYSWAQSEVEFFIRKVDSDAIHSERNLSECFENLKCLLDFVYQVLLCYNIGFSGIGRIV